MLSTDFVRMEAALTKVPYSIDNFEIDARLPADEQLKIFARYGWLDGPPSPLYYVQRRMVGAAGAPSARWRAPNACTPARP